MPIRDTRQLALAILSSVENGRRTLDHALHFHDSHLAALSGRDRAFLQALVFGVLRWRLRLDWVLGRFSRTPIHRMDPDILNILRIGVFQLLFMDRVPPSATVNTSVELVRTVGKARLTGFVNGVLRNIDREKHQLGIPESDASRPFDPEPFGSMEEALSIRHAMPPWLVRRWTRRFGETESDAFMTAMNRIAPLTGRVNTLRATREQVLAICDRESVSARPTPISPDGIFIDNLPKPIHEMEAIASGMLRIQDEAAQLVTRLLSPKPGHTVLDACAGRGGKTIHIAQRMGDRGTIVAVDADRHRLDQLITDLSHLGITSVRPTEANLHDPLPKTAQGPFDRILLDAPCSGLGVIRRNPDTKWSRFEPDLKRYAHRQQAFLNHLAPLVKPSGLLVYAVCSLEPEENEQVIQDFIAKHPEFGILRPTWFDGFATHAELIGPDGCLRTYPHRHDMDGFFAAILKRNR